MPLSLLPAHFLAGLKSLAPMRVNLATKFSVALVCAVVMAVLSSGVALYAMWHITNIMDATDTENLLNVRAAARLEAALLEQKGLVASYLVSGGDVAWLRELRARKEAFKDGMSDARATADTDAENRILDRLDKIYRQLDSQREAAIGLYQKGRVAEAKAILLQDVNFNLYERANALCEDFIKADERYIIATTDRVKYRVEQVTEMVGAAVGVTVALSVALVWLFFYRVLFPLRKMIAEARQFAGESPALATNGQPGAGGTPQDELSAIGGYLRELMSDMQTTRSTLERSRDQLRSAEKLASVGKLAASVAHEIRNPLTAIKMWLFAIRKNVRGDAELDRRLGIISDEMTRLETIVRNFLEFSRPPALKRQPESLSLLLDKTLQLLRPPIEAKKIALVREGPAELPPVMADRQQLEQVFINLLNNAAEATGEGGRIRVWSTVAPDGSAGGMVAVRICDNGCGMPADVQSRVFEPFFSTKESGTGLGLCIAAGIMARHDGRLVLESSSEQGTTFAVYLPIAKAELHE